MEDKVMNHLGYQGSVMVSFEDGILHGAILNINDLVTYEAETIPELKIAFQESVEEYIEYCKSKGLAPNKPMSGSFNVRIGPDLHKKAVQFANSKGLALNEVVKSAISNFLLCDGKEVHHHFHIAENVERASWVTQVAVEAAGQMHSTTKVKVRAVVH